MADEMRRPAPQKGYLQPRGRSFVWGAVTMLVLVQTGAAFNWPVFNWLADHRPTFSITTEQRVQP